MPLISLLLACSFALPQAELVQEQHPELQVPKVLPQDTADPVLSFEERSLATLAALSDSRQSKLQELQELRDSFDPNVDSEHRLEQLEEAHKLQLELRRLEYDFESIATGIDVRAFDLEVEQDFDFIEEIQGLLQPMVSELRAATEAPREMERLRAALQYAEEHKVLAQAATQNLNELIDLARTSVEDEARRAELLATLEHSSAAWHQRLRDLDNQYTVVQFQLEQRVAEQRSVFDSAQTALADFFRTRGLHLLLALAAFVSILFGLRAAHRGVSKLLRKRAKGGERKFYARLIDVLYFGFSGLAALSGALLVLYSAGDWAILGLAILLLLGLAWASKTAAPIFFEQIRLLLNLGTVREGERVVFQGLPWRVSRLSLNALLVNKELAGGRLRVPLRDMTPLRSRSVANKETWFPTSQGDWILLDGERLARVEFQSTEVVRVELQGGSVLCFPTIDFLGMRVENLRSGFRIQQRFGIDYDHQAICTDEVPRLMRESLESGLRASFAPELLRKLKVEFLEAAASSLDYAVLADFEADAAPRYMELQRALQRLLVEACNEHGWTIPFTQLTVHGIATPIA